MLRGVAPGLGFSHLAAGRASGARGVPRGEPSDSAEACRDQCHVTERCGAWSFKPKERKCFLGNCTGVYSPCFEEVPANPPPVGGVSRPSPNALSCGAAVRPRGAGRGAARGGGGGGAGRGAGKDGRLNRRRVLQAGGVAGRRAQATGSGRRLALLVLGHRGRLMFDTLPGTLVAPLVAGGTEVRFFAWLENSSMAAAFRGRRPMGHPAFAALDDRQLAREMRRRVHAAGGAVGAIRIGPRPLATLPAGTAGAAGGGRLAGRLWRYSEGVKLTVATRLLKESLGLRLVEEDEGKHGLSYTWVLWTREDAHWFAPLDLASFEEGVVHGKGCGGFGGWNDKARAWAPRMLGMYHELHTPHPVRCTLAPPPTPSAATGGRTAPMQPQLPQPQPQPPQQQEQQEQQQHAWLDALSAPSVEQFRARVGALHRAPFRRHPPAAIPTMDSYYRALQPGERGESEEGVGRQVAPPGWRLCFPPVYAHGCVPPQNQSAVEQMACGERKAGAK